MHSSLPTNQNKFSTFLLGAEVLLLLVPLLLLTIVIASAVGRNGVCRVGQGRAGCRGAFYVLQVIVK